MWGTVVIPLLLLYISGIFIGWAKPVPYNPYNLNDQKYGNLKVAIAGPAANVLIAVVLGLLLRFAPLYANSVNFITPMFLQLVGFVVFVNIFLAIFNLIPIPPLDGSKVLGDLFPRFAYRMQGMGLIGIFLAIFLAFYILAPIAQLIFWLITGVSFGF
jgi:Zn-dependent protease